MSRRPLSTLLTRFQIENHTLVIDLETHRRVLSSAPRGGGLVRARYILNHQVPANPVMAPVAILRSRENPARYLGWVAARCGARGTCVALMTAVSLQQLVTLREERDGVWVEGFFTVGITNAVRAGEGAVPAVIRVGPDPGTINIILVTNARLAASAMVGAVQVATESKTAVLLAQAIPSWTGQPGATGTGTDAVVIASGADRKGPMFRYSGTHTVIGILIGRLVRRGVSKGLDRSAR